MTDTTDPTDMTKEERDLLKSIEKVLGVEVCACIGLTRSGQLVAMKTFDDDVFILSMLGIISRMITGNVLRKQKIQ